MNCLTARETLDSIRPHDQLRPDETRRPDEVAVFDTDGHELPAETLDEAARHVKSCPACQTAVRRREKIDERIRQLSRDLPVPEGLRERLLDQLARDNSSESHAGELQTILPQVASTPVTGTPVTGKPVTGKPAVRSRRRMMVSTVAACVAMVAGVCIWEFWPSRHLPLSVDEIAGFALDGVKPAADLPVLTQFKGGLAVQLPSTIQKLSRSQPWQRLVDPRLGDREIAITYFTLSDGKRGKFDGLLVVIPAAAVKDLPAASSFAFAAGQPLYRGLYCTAAWTEGKFVYLCCVRGGERELKLLLPATQNAA
jgi:hypothetical protein